MITNTSNEYKCSNLPLVQETRYATTTPAVQMWETGSLNRDQFMVQWFIRFNEFAEFLSHLGKTPMPLLVWVILANSSIHIIEREILNNENSKIFATGTASSLTKSNFLKVLKELIRKTKSLCGLTFIDIFLEDIPEKWEKWSIVHFETTNDLKNVDLMENWIFLTCIDLNSSTLPIPVSHFFAHRCFRNNHDSVQISFWEISIKYVISLFFRNGCSEHLVGRAFNSYWLENSFVIFVLGNF